MHSGAAVRDRLSLGPRSAVSSLFAAFWFLTCLSGHAAEPCPRDDHALDKAFDRLWEASTPRRRQKAAGAVAKAAEGHFDAIFQRLRKGRTYTRDVPTGKLIRTRAVDGHPHHYTLLVPESYDPDHAYTLEVFLHGGVGRGPWKRDGSWWHGPYEHLKRDNRIALFPASWVESMWWYRSQSTNLMELIDVVRSTYHIDDNRIMLSGISDGATGAFYHAAHNPTPWAAYFCYIGHAGVLANKDMGADGDFFPVNLTNKPMYVVNTAHDRLYPNAIVTPFIELFRHAGADITFRPIPDAGHDLSWMPAELPAVDAYRDKVQRMPYPRVLTWETESTKRYNRIHYLIIDTLGTSATDPQFPDFNTSRDGKIWPRSGPSGRLGLVREGNHVAVRSSGVRAFTLLLSPDVFDFSRQMRVEVNGKRVFEGAIHKDPVTLLKWFAQDNDPSMLFAAELHIDVP